RAGAAHRGAACRRAAGRVASRGRPRRRNGLVTPPSTVTMRNRHLSPILLCVAIAAPRAHTAGGGQDLPRPTPAAVPARHQDPERRPSDPEPRARVAAVGIVEASGGASLPGATVRCVGVVPATHDTFAAP